MTTNIGSLAVSLSLDASNFNGSMAQVDRNLRAMGSELRAVRARGTEYGNSLEGLGARQDVLRRSLDAANIKLAETRRRYDEMVASGTASDAQLERQARRVNEAQTQYNRLETELNQVNNQLRIQSSSWQQISDRLAPIGQRLTSIGQGMKNVGRDLSMYVTAPLVAMGTGAFKAAVDFESAFAGVRKTVSASEEEFSSLEKGIRDMAKAGPSTANELAAIAEAAGQLGIETDNILTFTSTMSDLGTATNMSSEQAATSLARLANITQMPQTEFDRLGATIVALGNNMATTESEITEFGLRIAGAGAQVGLTEAQIMSVGAALSSVGINAEAGGTAISKVMIELANVTATGGKELDQFAKVAGMSGKDFKKAFEDDAASAIVTFIEGLGKMSESGENVFAVIEDLGLQEVRVRDALLRASGAGDLLRESLDLGSTAWEENTALTKEAGERYKTTASQMQTLWNQIVDVGISLGEVLIPKVQALMDKIKPLIERFANMSTESQNLVLILGGVAAAIGPLLVIGGTLMSGLGGLVTTVSALSGAVATAGGASAVFGGALAVLTGPVGLAVAGLTALTVGGIALYNHLKKDAIPEVDRFGEGVSDATQKALGGFFELSDGASQKLTELSLAQQRVTEETKVALVEQFSQMNEQILAKMDERHTQEMEKTKNFFLNSSALTSAEEEKILRAQEMRNQSKIAGQEYKEARIKEILERASTEKRVLTESEQKEINSLQQQMNENAVTYLSENEVEAKVIMERMKQSAGDLSAKQAAEVVKNSNEQKDKAVKAANEQYDQTLAEIIRMRDETGDITADQADRMIREATKQRDETVKRAEDMHKKVVDEAKKQAGEHINTVNWETGEILSKWDVFWNNTKQKFKEAGSSTSKAWKEFTNDLKKDAIAMIEGIKEIWNNLMVFFKEMPVKMTSIGKDIIRGLINGIGSMARAVWDKAESIARGIGDSIKKALDINSPSKVTMELGKWTGEGLAIGIDDMVSEVNKSANKLANATIPDIPSINAGLNTTSVNIDANKQSKIMTNPINVVLNYQGNNINDAYSMVDIIESELGSRYNSRLRMRGMKQ